MLELMNYEGCGRCEKFRNDFKCNAHTESVTIKFNKCKKWDRYGEMVTAFRAGDAVKGTAVIADNKVYCAVAESTIYEGIEDFIALDNVEITQ